MSSGGDTEHPDGVISYSIGQPFYEVASGLEGYLWEGVQQPYEIYRNIPPLDEIVIELFPNPTHQNLTLFIIDYFVENLTFVLFDSRSRVLYAGNITSLETIIPMEMLSAGVYMLSIMHYNQKFRSYKIIKI